MLANFGLIIEVLEYDILLQSIPHHIHSGFEKSYALYYESVSTVDYAQNSVMKGATLPTLPHCPH